MSDLKELSQRQVPLERVVPLNSNRLVTFVNHFLISIVQQLNELSALVDSRLYDLNNQILRCNANLVILEMKLNSISGLSSVVNTKHNVTPNPINDNSVPTPQTTAKTDINSVEDIPQTEETNCIETHITTETTTPKTQMETNGHQIEEKAEVEEREEDPEDPRMAKYKKMLQLGIPLDAVHQKMRLEGVDESLLKP